MSQREDIQIIELPAIKICLIAPSILLAFQHLHPGCLIQMLNTENMISYFFGSQSISPVEAAAE